ncbi:IncA protein [Chlamydia poikilotherma]|uniref:IncA protein n=1 Tax=Chlamydia poikilotherma TaxID=1967783 RepID=A0A3B0PZJ4_9CHLA|nr:stage II sporulation protein M [Chlamydia poikilotherma]SYX08835.1 IncA protein [Chlamydia poikilotherma]
MSEPKPIYQSPALNQVEIGKSFLDNNPKIAKAIQATGIVLAILAIVASVFLIMGTPIGLPISMALGGVLLGVGGSMLFTSVNSLAQTMKRAAVEHKRKKILLQEKPEIKPKNETLEGLWPRYDRMVDGFAHLNMEIGKHEKSVLKQIGRKEGLEFIESFDQITSDYLICASLLKGRQTIYSEEDYAQRDDSYPSVGKKNQLLIKLGDSITSRLSKGGGVFSLKMQELSSTMSKVHAGVTLGLVAGGIAAVGVIAAIIPGGILALPMILAAAIGIGLAVLGLSYAIKTILKRSKTNKKQLFKDLQSTIDIKDLKDMTRDQAVLMSMLKVSLQTDQRMTLDNRDFYRHYNEVKDTLEFLNEHLAEMEFRYKHLSKEHQQRATKLERGLSILSDRKNAQEGSDYNPQVPASDQEDLLNDTGGFDELVSKGIDAARRRRQVDRDAVTFIGDYEQHLDDDELRFGSGWSPSGKRALEKMWSAKPPIMNEEDYFILNEDVNKVLSSYRNDIQAMKSDIQKVEQLFIQMQAGKNRLENYSEQIIGIWTDVSSSCHTILNHLVGMQMRLVAFIESGGRVRPNVRNLSKGKTPY